MTPVGSPLYSLLNEINHAAKNGMPFLAVAMAVALPDICVSLVSADGRSDGPRYRAWCDQNLPAELFDYVTGDDLYSMRCGVLHNGRFGDLKHNVERVIFLLPDSPSSFINCRVDDAYFYSVVDFCKSICDAVFTWSEKNMEDATMKANLPRLMQYRVGGLPPYVAGMTVLA